MQEEANPVEDQDGPAPAKLSQGFTPNRALMGSFEHFVDHYQKYKSLRTLIFRQNLGSVELTLSFKNGDFPFSVTPIQAAVISLFSSASDQSVQLTLDELHNNINNNMISSETNSSLSVSVDQLKQELTYWVCRGVLAQSGGRLYSTVNVYEPRKQAHESEGGEGLQVQQKSGPTSTTRPQAAKPAQRSEEDNMISRFITTILRPSPAQQEQGKTLEKIYSALNNMYMPGMEIKEEKVKEVLQQMAMEDKVTYVGSKYVLL